MTEADDRRAITGLTNWAGNHAYVARALHEPRSLEELQELVRRSRSLRVLGSRHSFNDIADTTGDLVSLAGLPRIFELDRSAGTVTVDGGVRYGELCGPLHAAGFALHNLASLPHISVAGACATATHGSGDRNGNLATAVTAVELLRADGETVALSRTADPETFPGAVVGLGALGVVTRVTLRLEPTFQVRQDLYEDLPLRAVADHFDEITGLADSVSLFTEWRGPVFEEVWLKRRVDPALPFDPPPTLHGATRATVPIHPIRRMPADACTEQLGVPGPWHERLPHFRMDHTPSAGAELQTEYLLPRRHAVDALIAIDGLRDRIAPLLHGLRGPDGRGGRPLDEHRRRPRVGRAALHLAAGLDRRPRGAARARGGPRAVRAAAALGEADDHAARGDPCGIPAVAGLHGARRSVRPRRHVPERLPAPRRARSMTAADDLRIRRLQTSDVGPADLLAIRDLLVSAFGPGLDERFTKTDWDHSLGGTHFVAELGGAIVAHASVIEREIEVGGKGVRTGYVEAVAVAPDHQGQGIGSRLMREVDAWIAERYELGVLGTGRHAFYERLGWTTWRGPAFVRTPDGPRRTPDEEGFILVLETPSTPPLDRDSSISCDWRPGDVW